MKNKIYLLLFGIFIIFNLFSLFLNFKYDYLQQTKFTNLSTLFWFVSVIFSVITLIIIFHQRIKKIITKIENKQLLLIIIIVLFALLLRLNKLTFISLKLDEWY
jgi:hypothetical protein